MRARFIPSLPRVVLLVSLLASACGVWADTVELTSGSKFDGRLISRDTQYVTFEVQIGQVKIERRFPAAEVAKLIVAGEDVLHAQPAVEEAASDDSSLADEDQDVSIVDDAIPSTMPNGPCYFLIPIRGSFGKEVDPLTIGRCLKLAQRIRPTIIVFDISSNGGSTDALLQIMELLDKWLGQESIPIVGLVRERATSTAALFALSLPNVYMMRGAEFGVSYTANDYSVESIPSLITAGDLDQPSVELLQTKSIEYAQRAGHNPLLVEAIISPQVEVWLVNDTNGRSVLVRGPILGGRIQAVPQDRTLILRQESMPVLGAERAVNVGLAKGVVSDLDQLGSMLNYDEWNSVSDVPEQLLALRIAKVDRIQKLYGQYVDAVTSARSRYYQSSFETVGERLDSIANIRSVVAKIERLVTDNPWLIKSARRDFPGGIANTRAEYDRQLDRLRSEDGPKSKAQSRTPSPYPRRDNAKKVRTVTVQRGSSQGSNKSQPSGSSGNK